ncbi:MAG: efflux RND transporter periplasmic adaptor subunit [Pseudomonadota bacterium]
MKKYPRTLTVLRLVTNSTRKSANAVRTGTICSVGLALTVLTTALPTNMANAASVGVAQVVRGNLANQVTLVGSAIPRRVTQVSAQVAGLITHMQVDRGSQVRANQPLFNLDSDLARLELRRAQAQLAQADAALSESRRKYAETERLRADGHVPQSTLDTAQTGVDISLAQRDERKALVDRAQLLLDQHAVVAPFAGTVVAKNGEVGQWIRSDSAVLELVETNPARIEVPVPEHYFSRLANGASATVRFDAMPETTFNTQVGALVPQGFTGARTFPVWLELSNAEARIAPGMSARVTLSLDGPATAVLLVPNDALVRRADGTTLVWLVRDSDAADGQQIARSLQVQVGETIGDNSQVDGQGLSAGDLVVVRGNESLRPNQAVRVTNPTLGGR